MIFLEYQHREKHLLLVKYLVKLLLLLYYYLSCTNFIDIICQDVRGLAQSQLTSGVGQCIVSQSVRSTWLGK